MTTRDAARVLGIGVTTLIRMEGSEFIAVPRRGRRGMRVFSEAVVEQVREHLQQSTLAGRAAAIAAASGLRLAR